MVKESEVFLISYWEYKVVSDSKGKELHARFRPEELKKDAPYTTAEFKVWKEGVSDELMEWIVVSDISEMKLWRFNKLVDKLDDMGHSVAVIASVFAMEMVFTEEGEK